MTQLPPDKTTVRGLLQRMAWFARHRRENYADAGKHAAAHRYLRLGGDGFVPVSIEPHRPCGSLRPGGSVTKSATIERALEKLRGAEEALARDHDGTLPEPKGTKKLEHKLQAFLIKRALTAPDSLPALLDLRSEFDRLFLVTDELRLEDAAKGEGEALRMDMLFVGERAGRYRPVLVELKILRSNENSPFKQLTAAQGVLAKHPEELRALLSEGAIGAEGPLPPERIDVDAPALLGVVPGRADGGPKSLLDPTKYCPGAIARYFAMSLLSQHGYNEYLTFSAQEVM